MLRHSEIGYVIKGLSTASVQRNFTIKAMVNFTIQELGLDCRNAFVGVYLAPEDNKKKRQPLTDNQIQRCNRTATKLTMT